METASGATKHLVIILAILSMNKIKQLKTLLATKDARQLRKDGEELLKAWEEEEDKRDDRVYQKVGKRYEPIGLFYDRDWLTDGGMGCGVFKELQIEK